MAWRIEFTRNADKAMRKLDKGVAARMLDELDEIAKLEDPRSRGKALTGNLAGVWRYRVGDYRIFDDEPAPRYSFHSTVAAMFGAIFYRYGCVPAKCKNCGNGILVKTKGKRREFCSPSCRTRYSNRKAGP